jgi:hypothetical protein
VKINEVMTRDMRVASPGQSIREAAQKMADLVAAVRRVHGVRAFPDRLTTYLDAIGVPELQGGISRD